MNLFNRNKYTEKIDDLRNKCSVIIDLSKIIDNILSIERINIGTKDEETWIFTKGDNLGDYSFHISRFQHEELINKYKELKTLKDLTVNN